MVVLNLFFALLSQLSRSFDHTEEPNLFKIGSLSKQHNPSDDDGDGIDFDESEAEQNRSSAERFFDLEESVRGEKKSPSQSLKSMSLVFSESFLICLLRM